MNPILKHDRESIIAILTRTLRIAESYYNDSDTLPPSRVEDEIIHAPLPEYGRGALDILELFASNYSRRMSNSAGPNYFGFVTGGSTPAAVAGDWLVSVYDQVMSGSNDSVAHLLERQTIEFMLTLFGLGSGFTGTFVTGATMSNFVGLALGRQWIGEQYGVDASKDGLPGIPPIRVLSATPHSSIYKSLSMLGLGRNALKPVETLPDREAIDIVALEACLSAEGPVIVVANAGTVNTVDFDNLEEIANLRERFPFYLHVDAAFGGFAALSDRYKHLVTGIDKADSVTIDAHKWLNVPYDAAMTFTRHRNLQLKVFQNNAAYLGEPNDAGFPDNMHLTPENSRRFRALPAWFSLMAYGAEGYREIVERNCDAATLLGQLLAGSDHFTLLSPVRMNVVCFSFQTLASMDEVRHFLDMVRDDGRVFFTPTMYKGRPAIRAAVSNWQTSNTEVRRAFEVLCEVYQKMTVNLNIK